MVAIRLKRTKVTVPRGRAYDPVSSIHHEAKVQEPPPRVFPNKIDSSMRHGTARRNTFPLLTRIEDREDNTTNPGGDRNTILSLHSLGGPSGKTPLRIRIQCLLRGLTTHDAPAKGL